MYVCTDGMYVCTDGMYVCMCVYVCIYVCMYKSNADDYNNYDCKIIQPADGHVVFFNVLQIVLNKNAINSLYT